MSLTQTILIVIAAMSVLLAADLLKTAARTRNGRREEAGSDWRSVGTFGRSAGRAMDPHSAQSGPMSLKAAFVLLAMAAAGVSFKFAWDEAHPDIRSRYGRAYERCVSEEHLNRWQISQVRTCAEARMWH